MELSGVSPALPGSTECSQVERERERERERETTRETERERDSEREKERARERERGTLGVWCNPEWKRSSFPRGDGPDRRHPGFEPPHLNLPPSP